MRLLLVIVIVAVMALWFASSELFPGNSRLYDAIELGDEVRVRALLEAGADANSQSHGMRDFTWRYRSPPLLYAIAHGQPGIALLLLDAGAAPDGRHLHGSLPLVAAAEGGMVDVVRALIDAGADAAATQPDGSTALHYGPTLASNGVPLPRDHLDPRIRAMLEAAVRRRPAH